MQKDSLETLLLRHYGPTAANPPGLEQRLLTSVRQEAKELQQQQLVATRLRTKRVSRRRIVGLVALSSAGLGVLSVSLESLQKLEANLLGQDTTQFRPALS